MKRKGDRDMKPERVEQLMRRNVATCRPDDGLNTAAQIMWDHDCGVVPVTVPEEEGERVVGMLTDRDVCMAAYTQGRPLTDVPVSTAMRRGVRAIGPADSIASALAVMATAQVRRLPVVDPAGHLVGLLSFADVAREEARCRAMVVAEELVRTVEAIAAPRPHALIVVAA